MTQSDGKQGRILIVDDEADLRSLLQITFKRMGLSSVAEPDLHSARERLKKDQFDLCLTDMRLPDGRGMELVEEIQQRYPHMPVAVITAFGNMELAVEALRAGAFDCVSKPVDLDVLRALVNRALTVEKSPAVSASSGEERLVGRSRAMRALKERIDKLARSQAPVCISGESGTGKEVIAREIHARGPRADKPFIPVNCGAIPADLIESEFFGHLKGAFTGASQPRSGFFQAAEGGTLFLDEIADMPLPMQVKLLRAIQERRIRPIGSEKELPVDVRILSASHKALDREVREGRFREDLYYRINVIDLHVPPLRERPEDVELLTERILAQLADVYGQSFELTESARSALVVHDFPGNVRELENILERAAALCEHSKIQAADLGLSEEPPRPGKNAERRENLAVERSLDYEGGADNEFELITEALEARRWNRTAAAKDLGLTLRQLRYRMKKYHID
ncbi:MAG: sigma-54-dependent Fis family transcriptional regulator [Oceanospirillaceae bacterium]|nr:sigma-54-dependent Fis family transcriptional regulator [Oceanospirillaceae bacterium]